MRLYGSPLTSNLPDLASRHFTRESYPELHNALTRQFTAPFDGTTSIVSEHTAPTLMDDVIVRSHWRVLEDDDGPMWDRVVIVDFDVSDLRKAERELKELLVEKDELVRLKDRLIASVAHEMRTPLSSIVGFAELLREAANLGPEVRIFEAYHRGDQESSNSGHALGLGLHISRSLARHMSGDLTYRHEGGWSIFELFLPLVTTRAPAS